MHVVEVDYSVRSQDIDGWDGERAFPLWLEGNSEGPWDSQIDVREQIEGQTSFQNGLEHLRRRIRADGNDLESQLDQLGLNALQLDQLPVAVRSPPTAINNQHRRLAGQGRRELHGGAIRGHQSDIRYPGPDQNGVNSRRGNR